MPRKLRPKPCRCGCGQTTRGGEYLSGHKQQHMAALVRELGGIAGLERIIKRRDAAKRGVA